MLTITDRVQQLRAEAAELTERARQVCAAAKFKMKGPHWDEARPLRELATAKVREANELEAGSSGAMSGFVAGVRADVQIVCGTEYMCEADAVARSFEHVLPILGEDAATGLALSTIARLISADAGGQYRSYQHCDAPNAWAGLKDRATQLYGWAAAVQRAANSYLVCEVAA
jgi:hypothetical protein